MNPIILWLPVFAFALALGFGVVMLLRHRAREPRQGMRLMEAVIFMIMVGSDRGLRDAERRRVEDQHAARP